MNKDCPIPNNNPVMKRIGLELFLHFHRCVNPSITNGIAISIGIHMGTVIESITDIGTNTYPSSIAKHLAQISMGFPFM
jgi:hypothetical protein